MEVNGGSAVSLISEGDYNKIFAEYKLCKAKIKLNYYSGEKCAPLGRLKDLR